MALLILLYSNAGARFALDLSHDCAGLSNGRSDFFFSRNGSFVVVVVVVVVGGVEELKNMYRGRVWSRWESREIIKATANDW